MAISTWSDISTIQYRVHMVSGDHGVIVVDRYVQAPYILILNHMHTRVRVIVLSVTIFVYVRGFVAIASTSSKVGQHGQTSVFIF